MEKIRRYTRKEACAYLGCGENRFYKLISNGYLARGTRLGKTAIWFQDQLEHTIALLKREAGKGVKK